MLHNYYSRWNVFHLLWAILLIVLTISIDANYETISSEYIQASSSNTSVILAPDNIWNPVEFIEPITWNKSDPFFRLLILLDLTFPNVPGINGLTIQLLEAAIHVIDLINSDDSVIPNTSLVYSIADSQSVPELALNSVLKHIVKRDIISIIGPPSSVQAFVTGSATELYNISFMSSTATSSQLPKEYLTTFLQFAPDDDKLVRSMASTIHAMGWNLIAPLFSSDEYGLFGRSNFITSSESANIYTTCADWIIPPLASPGVFSNGTVDVAYSFAKCVANSDLVNVVFLFMDATTAAYVISVLYSMPNNNRLTFIATDAWYNFRGVGNPLEMYNVPMEYLFGTISLVPSPGNTSVFEDYFSSLNPENTQQPQFLDYWQTQFRCIYNPADDFIPLCDPDYWSNTSTRTLPPCCRCTGQENLSYIEPDYSVMYMYDMLWSVALGLDRILNHCDLVSDQSICSKESISGKDLHQVVSKMRREGYTGIIAFKNSTRIGSSFSIYQSVGNGTSVLVGSCIDDVVTFNQSMILFKNGQSNVSSSIELAPIEFPNTAPVIFAAICGIILAISLFYMIVFFVYRKHPVTRKSSPLFCQLVLLGIIIISIGVILNGTPTTAFLCVLIVWLPVLGLGLIYASLLAKSYRILRVYSTLSAPSSSMSDASLLKFTIGVILLELAILCAYSFANGIHYPAVVISDVDPLYSYPTCIPTDGTVPLAPLIIIIAVNAILVGVLGIIAYLTRHTASAYNESKQLAIVTYSYIIIIVVAIPLYFGRQDGDGSAEQRYLVLCISLILSALIPLVFLLTPKIISILSINNRLLETDSNSIIESRIAELGTENRFKADFLTRRMWKKRIDITAQMDKRYDTSDTTTMMIRDLERENASSNSLYAIEEDNCTNTHNSDTSTLREEYYGHDI